jgi:hypothetical protein
MQNKRQGEKMWRDNREKGGKIIKLIKGNGRRDKINKNRREQQERGV